MENKNTFNSSKLFCIELKEYGITKRELLNKIWNLYFPFVKTELEKEYGFLDYFKTEYEDDDLQFMEYWFKCYAISPISPNSPLNNCLGDNLDEVVYNPIKILCSDNYKYGVFSTIIYRFGSVYTDEIQIKLLESN